MSDWLDDVPSRRDGVTIPIIWVALALSLLVHIAVLWKWLPHIRFPSLETPERGEGNGSLVVRLAPPPTPPPAPPSSPALPPPPSLPSPALKTLLPKAARARPAPPVIALNRPTPTVPAPPVAAQALAPPPATPAPVRPPAGGDLAAYVEARRRARAESAADVPPMPNSAPGAPAIDDAAARSNRIVAGNLGSQRRQTFGYDPRQGGGIFQITSVGYNNAEFIFFGWNKDIRRTTKQYIEVNRGNNSDIRIAVVRKMIAIIREYEQEDFLWESLRLERNIMLSARARDNSGLEDFMMREFFSEPRYP